MFWKRLWGKTAADLIRLYMLAVYRPRKTGFRPPEGPVIYVSNHINHLDGMLLLVDVAYVIIDPRVRISGDVKQ